MACEEDIARHSRHDGRTDRRYRRHAGAQVVTVLEDEHRCAEPGSIVKGGNPVAYDREKPLTLLDERQVAAVLKDDQL